MVIKPTILMSNHPSLKEYHENLAERTQDLADEEKGHEMLPSEHDTSVEDISNIKPVKIPA